MLNLHLREASPDDIDAARARLSDTLDAADQLDAAAIERIRQMVERAAEQLQVRWLEIGIGAGTEWDAFIVPHMQAAVYRVAAEFAGEVGATLETFLPQAAALGDSIVLETIGGAGLEVSALPSISTSTLRTLATYDANLVTNIETVVRNQINTVIENTFVQGGSPWETMERLRYDTDMPSGPWRTVEYRGEIVARTEIARVQGAAEQHRLEQTATQFPEMGLKKVWLVAHIREWPCEKCSAHEGKLWDVFDHNAPALPAHPNCRCSWMPYLPGLSPEVPTAAQRKKTTISRDTKIIF